MTRERSGFDRVADRTSDLIGSTGFIVAAVAMVFGWLILGPIMRWSDTWQLLINTPTTVLTFLMIPFLQRSQNVDTQEIKAMDQATVEAAGLEAEVDAKLDDRLDNPT